jgi:hypothetical protein
MFMFIWYYYYFLGALEENVIIFIVCFPFYNQMK